MKRSASLSDLPSFSVEDEDEPLEKKIKLASTAHPAEVAQPVRICRTACSSKGSVVTNKCSLVYGHAEVSHLYHLVLTCNTGCFYLPRLPAAIPLQLPQVFLGHFMQEASECRGCGLGKSWKCCVCCKACVVSNLHRQWSLLFRTVVLLREI